MPKTCPSKNIKIVKIGDKNRKIGDVSNRIRNRGRPPYLWAFENKEVTKPLKFSTKLQDRF